MAHQEHHAKPHKEHKPSHIPWLQLLLGAAALFLAVNIYRELYPLPPNTLEIFLIAIGLYQLYEVQRRTIEEKRKHFIKRYL